MLPWHEFIWILDISMHRSTSEKTTLQHIIFSAFKTIFSSVRGSLQPPFFGLKSWPMMLETELPWSHGKSMSLAFRRPLYNVLTFFGMWRSVTVKCCNEGPQRLRGKTNARLGALTPLTTPSGTAFFDPYRPYHTTPMPVGGFKMLQIHTIMIMIYFWSLGNLSKKWERFLRWWLTT